MGIVLIMYANNTVPLVEKYRPICFDEIVLDDMSKTILVNIIKKGTFPNILLYGPPGTGKTTTAINLIRLYQKTYGTTSNSIMHLNASDDRGIDVIRTQINTFVSSRSLFETGLKFVILDEADYMTKPAQTALKALLHKYGYIVRICLICNYINKIDSGLISEFVSFKFNNIPRDRVFTLLRHIVVSENINLTDVDITNIQLLYSSDIRSMINCIQTFQYVSLSELSIITPELLQSIYTRIETKQPIHDIIKVIMGTTYDPRDVIYHLFNDILRNKPHKLTTELLDIMSTVLQFPECPLPCFINYVITQLYTKI